MSWSVQGIVEGIFNRARNVNNEELEKFFDKVVKSSGDVDNLRQLFLLTHCTRLKRLLPADVANVLLSILCDQSQSSSINHLCQLILQDSSPLPSLQLEEVAVALKDKSIVHILPLLLQQSQSVWFNEKVLNKILRCLSHKFVSGRTVMKLFAFVGHLSNVSELSFSQELVDAVNRSLGNYLLNASIYEASHSGAALFRRHDSWTMVTEVDGIPAQEFFTVLNLANQNSDDQFINMSAFSMVRGWLISRLNNGNGKIICSSLSELLIKLSDYCIRLSDQCDRNPLRPEDKLLQEMCLLEAVYLLDVICQLNSVQTASIFGKIKEIHNKLMQQASRSPQKEVIVIATAEFSLHHSNSIAYDCSPMLDNVLNTVVASNYHDLNVAFELVQFLLHNEKLLSDHGAMLVRYFPNILKILACNPRTFFEEFITLLPVCITCGISVEMFHSIIDLPCLAASLLLSQITSGTLSENNAACVTPTVFGLTQSFGDPVYKPMFAFMLRNNSGVGDTFDRLDVFHALIHPLATHPWVTNCGDLVAGLLRHYFRILLTISDSKHLIRLLPAILERIRLLYDIPNYVVAIQRVLADELLNVFKRRPSLVLEGMADLLDYVANISNFSKSDLFFTNIVWIIGEYASTDHVPDLSPKVIRDYSETLECTLFEVLDDPSWNVKIAKLINTLCMTVTKLSTRSQDLLPRAKFTLTKIGQKITSDPKQYEEKDIVIARLTQLLALLQMSLAATTILNPVSAVLDGRVDVHPTRNVNEKSWSS